MNKDNIQLIEKNNEITVQYVPDELDAVDTSFCSPEELKKISHTQKLTSWAKFLRQWVIDHRWEVLVVVFVGLLLNANFYNHLLQGVLGWLGAALARALDFAVYTAPGGQQITVSSLFIYGYLANFAFFQLTRIPHLLKQQRENDRLQAEKELLRRVKEYRQAKLRAYEYNQRLQEWANNLLSKQITLNQQSQKLLTNFYPLAELKEGPINQKIFSQIRKEFVTPKTDEENSLLPVK